jgi:hypothetical protein
LLLESGTTPNGDIHGAAEGSENTVGEFGFTVLAVGVVIHDHHKVVVAVRGCISTGLGAEEPDCLGAVGLDQAGDGIL